MDTDIDCFQGDDLRGKPYGKWTVIAFAGRRGPDGHSINVYWRCRCSCGEERDVAAANLTSGRSQSCGHREVGSKPVPDQSRAKGLKRRNNRMVEYQGRQMCVTDFAEQIGQRRALVFKRLNLGWSVERIAVASAGYGPEGENVEGMAERRAHDIMH